NPECMENPTQLNAKEGFVAVPFKVSDKNPIVLIHPDIIMEGEKVILNFIVKDISKSHHSERSPFETDINPTDTFQTYQIAFEQFQEALRSNDCEKIVLSRTFSMSRPSGFSAGNTFKAACEAYPEAYVYLCHTPLTGTWLGSSPELILSGNGTDWQTVALAGTKRASAVGETLNWDQKNIKEQHIVADYLEKQLTALHLTCTINGAFASRAGKLMHLKTEFSFKMADNKKIGDLLESLHPSPAVCGYPKETAYRLINEKEGYDRQYYSGFIGELSMNGKTNLYVNLRCMQIRPDSLTLFAGGGLLTSSELTSEWEETEEKLQTMLSLIEY
ncbi:MAG: isochorismate synthase, partial [Bacteroidales bacterium]|nr:isochorismate synthase [Bacteroidales bacterium]